MERLTKCVNGVTVYVGPGCKYPDTGEIPAELDAGSVRAVLCKLAAYEDTELTPEEIVEADKTLKNNWEIRLDRLNEAVDLIKVKDEGRLEKLPCKVGGTVYANFSICGDYLREKDRPYPCEVVFIGLSGEPFMHIQFPNGRVFPVKFDKIGKTVFLTREAAEAALKEQEG